MPWREILRFAVAGGANTLLTFAAYALMVVNGVPYPVANMLAWILGIICAYFLNLLFVFNLKRGDVRGSPRQFVKFAVMNLISFSVSTAVLIALVESHLLGPVKAQFVAIPLIVILNFTSSKYLVFRHHNP